MTAPHQRTLFIARNRSDYLPAFFFLTATNTAEPITTQAKMAPITISTALPALCSGALEDEGKRDAVAVRAGVAVPPAPGVAVGVTTVGLSVAAVVLLGRGVGVGVGAGVGSGVTKTGSTAICPISLALTNSSSGIAWLPFSGSSILYAG